MLASLQNGKALRWTLGAALVACVLGLSDWRAIMGTLRTMPLSELGVWCALNVLVLALLGARWQVLLDGFGAIAPLGRLTLHRLAGFGVSFLTPGPQFGGEPLQVLLLTRREAISRSAALGSVALDKMLDLAASFAFLVLGAVILSEQSIVGLDHQTWLRAAPFVPMGLMVVYLIALALGARPLTAMLAGARSPRLAPIRSTVASAEQRAAALFRERPGIMGKAILVTTGSWVVQIGEFWWMLRLLGAEATPALAISLLMLVRLAFLLPLPGGLGAVEAALVVGAPALGMPGHVGMAAALMIRARDLGLAAAGVGWGVWATDQRNRAGERDTPAFPVRSGRAAPRPTASGARLLDRASQPAPAPPSPR